MREETGSSEDDVSNGSAPFSAELRRRRLAAGLSLSGLAELLHYSKGHLSKIENGHKAPNPDFARRCDTALEASGELTELVPARASEDSLPEFTNSDEEVWVLSLEPDGGSMFRTVNRRSMLTAGAASVLALGCSTGRAVAETDQITAFREMFAQHRRLGQITTPSAVLPGLIAQTHSLREVAAAAGGNAQRELLVLTARYAEFIGWMAQEAGNERSALWWTDKAVTLAETGGDQTLTAYALVRRALVTLYRQDAAQTVELAQSAREKAFTDRVAGWAALHEAQGHALAGDRSNCERALDDARDHLSRSEVAQGPVLGATNLTDPAAMVAGWCMHDLGRTRDAAESLEREVDRLSPHALRSRARYSTRCALAYAAAGEIEHACALTESALPAIDAVGSATVLTDLRNLARALSRHYRVPAVQRLQPRLVTSLQQQF